jgi:DNA-binding transcriptional ArsR family regulator
MSLESAADPPDAAKGQRILDDPVVIRALAHPLRLKLHQLVGREGAMTAAQAARALDISQALASHHLRQLAKYGFVEPAEAGDHRERPYRRTRRGFSWENAVKDPEGAAAADVLEQLLAERAVDQLVAWQRRRGEADPRWRDNTGLGQHLVYLTPDEMLEVRAQLDALLGRLVERRPTGDPAARPPGAVPVDITIIAVPVPPTPNGG